MASVAATTGNEAAATAKTEDCCCLEFTPELIESYNEKTVIFKDKPFVKDKVWCFFYVPLNFGQVMTRMNDKIEKANASVPPKDCVLLADMCSWFSSRVYMSVSKEDVPNAEVVKISGTFLTKIFEGPYNKFGEWITQMKEYVKKEKGEDFDFNGCDMYAYYATCPGCAKKFGKCYTILYVKVD